MNEARKEFESRYEKDECIEDQVLDHINVLLNLFETNEQKNKIILMAISDHLAKS